MSEVLEAIPVSLRQRVRTQPLPAWMEPMRATLVHEAFSSPEWLFERKLDGVRALVFRGSGGVRLLSRNRQDLAPGFPELAAAVASEPAREFVADGEIVAFDGRRTSFERLQGRLGIRDPERALHSRIAVHLYLFDLLHLDGQDLRALPLRTRKTLLRRSLRFAEPLRFTTHRNAEGEAWMERACACGWEGLIAKRATSRYEHRRSRAWLKLKCESRQEFVIGGFTEPQGSRSGFGALLVGYHEDGALRYAGKVGTGWDAALLERLAARLRKLERSDSPFAERIREPGVHFVRPELVGEVGFTEWTRDGKLRHPRFLGLRPDKRAGEVVREVPR